MPKVTIYRIKSGRIMTRWVGRTPVQFRSRPKPTRWDGIPEEILTVRQNNMRSHAHQGVISRRVLRDEERKEDVR